jgi:shikimate dehydrogenase
MHKNLKLAVIGHPISHSLSPLMFAELGRHIGGEISCARFDVRPSGLPHYLDRAKSLRLDGFNVTMPLKREMFRLADIADARAKATGAANAIKLSGGKFLATNTDAPAFAASLRANKIKIKCATAAVFGTGGAARASVYALCEGGAATIYIVSRRDKKASALADSFSKLYPHTVFKRGHKKELTADIWINATPAGMPGKAGCKIPLLPANAPSACAVDWVYSKAQTPFIRAALKSGMKTVGGLEIFIRQALESWSFWSGERISPRLYAAIERTLR